jgi:hypothetical protein
MQVHQGLNHLLLKWRFYLHQGPSRPLLK